MVRSTEPQVIVPSPSALPSLQQSSFKPRPSAPPPIHRSTYPHSHVPAHADPPSYDAPQPSSGSVYHPPFPVPVIPPRKSTNDSSRPQQSAFQPSKANPSLVHPNTALSAPYHDSSPPSTMPSLPEPWKYRACGTLVCPAVLV
jgi:hypothetical protein